MKRNMKGQFGKGNSGGPGRPRRNTETTYLYTLMEKCDIETWGDIVVSAVQDAKDGDAKARDWLGKYLMGAANQSAPSLLSVNLELLNELDPVLLAHAKRIEDESMNELIYPKAYELAKEIMDSDE